MFDNLRESDSERQAFQEAMGLGEPLNDSQARQKPSGAGSLLGMTAAQRLVIALLLLLTVSVLGTLCLLVTGRISTF